MIYYLNPSKQSIAAGGDYEVHAITCHHCPDDKTKLIYLGNHQSAKSAIIFAKQHYPTMAVDIDGCFFCCREEHKEGTERF